MLQTKRKIEIFSAGCAACEDAIEVVNKIACPSCEITVLDMNEKSVSVRAKALGIRSVPALVVDGKLADCCSGRGLDEQLLRKLGTGSN